MRRKGDVNIGRRAYAVVNTMFHEMSEPQIAKMIGCDKRTIYAWRDGETPSGIFLQRLAWLGADIDWILTGRRKNQ